MKLTHKLGAFASALALAASAQVAAAAMVNISMNVFPTSLANPNGGGAFSIVAKTDSPVGIAAINAYLKDINIAGLDVENDIGAILNGGQPYVATIGSAINILYGQDVASGPIVGGVGTALKSDGPDPFGDPLWNDATLIFTGTYSSVVPMFTNAGNNTTDANVLASVIVGNAAIDADTTTVVRVEVPEPATIGLAVMSLVGFVSLRRPRLA
jgi:hypothetical protein